MRDSHSRCPVSWVCQTCNSFRHTTPGSVGTHFRQCRAKNVSAYNGENSSGIYPCTRMRGLNRFQSNKLKANRNRALYFANTSRLASELLNGTNNASCNIPRVELESYFRGLFEKPDEHEAADVHDCKNVLWNAVSVEEIEKCVNTMKAGTASGSDRVTIRELRAFDPKMIFLCILLNACIQVGRLPTQWSGSKTILLQKNGKSELGLKGYS
ncbi:hypothetical protein ACOME3_000530 [Neoechinorhynchus agilis]